MPTRDPAAVAAPAGEAFAKLVEVMARLRAPDGCPWDREQTHQTLARHLLEETHEVLEAIDGIPPALPALARAAKLSRRGEQVGFEWPSLEAVFAKLDEEIAEVHEELVSDDPSAERLEDELGDVLWMAAVLVRRLGSEPE